MAPDRLAALSARGDELLALPASARSAWLAALAPADADLLPHLRSLLNAASTDAPPSDPLSNPHPSAATAWPGLRQIVAQSLAESAAPVAGDLVGPYRLLGPLGEGGMGTVWRAERADGSIRRVVALKLPLAMPGQRRWAERFARERDILARLDHPHIARLFDAGLTPQGQPWLAMALIDGQPITTHADAVRLGLRARIGLFLQVLGAVQFAHAHLVVHRDIKPSNILVDASGQAQLLDFGIALPLDDEPGADGPLTEVGQVLLTPDYAAPEQLLRAPVSTTADVYSLGVVLFELLCGRRPFAPTQPGRAALEQAVLSTDPARPSRALREQADVEKIAAQRSSRPKTLAQQLRGDLDNILAKALQREPALRYPSAEAFAADLQRHLDGAPVLAHPASLGYRAAKFVRRNRVGVGAGAAVALALVAGTGLALWQAGAAREQARQAQRESRKARAVQDFLVGLFNAADPARAQGREQTVRELLDAGERDLQTKLAKEPELRAAVGGALVEIYNKLEDPRHALPLAQSRVELLRQSEGTGSADYAIALYTVGVAQYQLRQPASALATLVQAEAALAPHAARFPEEWLDLLRSKAQSLGQVGRDAEAVVVQQALIPQLAAHFGADDWEVLFERSGLAVHLARAGDRTRAAALARELLPRLAAAPPERGVEAAVMQSNLGNVLWQCGQLDEAIALLSLSAPALDRLQGPHTSSAAMAQRTLGLVLLDAGEYAQALGALRDFARRVGPAFANDAEKVALGQAMLVEPLLLLQRIDEAWAAAQAAGAQRPLLEALVNLFRRPGSDSAPRGNAAFASAPAASAAAASDAAVSVRARARWDSVAAGSDLLGGRPGAAAERAAAVARSLRALPERDFHDELLAAKASLSQALALAAAGDAARASTQLSSATAALRGLVGPTHPLLQQAELVRARVLRAGGLIDEAQRLDRSARAALQRQAGVTLPAELPLVL